MDQLDTLCQSMIAYYAGDPKRIHHFIKVHSLAALIGRAEGLPPTAQLTLEAAAYVHDIGIKPAEEKYGSCSGPHQEELGPAPARAMLGSCGFDPAVIERAVYLVGHHHTYTGIDGPEYQILVEADFLVNLYEDGVPAAGVRAAYADIFRTQTGRLLCRRMFGL